jgi:hypothetical protein
MFGQGIGGAREPEDVGFFDVAVMPEYGHLLVRQRVVADGVVLVELHDAIRDALALLSHLANGSWVAGTGFGRTCFQYSFRLLSAQSKSRKKVSFCS